MALVGLAVVAVVKAGPLSLGSSLVGIERVARTIFRLSETFEGSLGATRGLVTSGTTPLVVSFSFLAALTCSASLE